MSASPIDVSMWPPLPEPVQVRFEAMWSARSDQMAGAMARRVILDVVVAAVAFLCAWALRYAFPWVAVGVAVTAVVDAVVAAWRWHRSDFAEELHELLAETLFWFGHGHVPANLGVHEALWSAGVERYVLGHLRDPADVELFEAFAPAFTGSTAALVATLSTTGVRVAAPGFGRNWWPADA